MGTPAAACKARRRHMPSRLFEGVARIGSGNSGQYCVHGQIDDYRVLLTTSPSGRPSDHRPVLACVRMTCE